MSDRINIKVSEYAMKLVDHTISPEEFEDLNSILASDAQAARHYNECMVSLQNMREFTQDIFSKDSDLSESGFNRVLWQSLAAAENESPTVEIPQDTPARELIQKVEYQKVVHKFPKTSLAVFLASAAALLLMVLYVVVNPKEVPDPVATLTGINKVVWSDPEKAIQRESRLLTLQAPISLKKGVLEIDYDYGAKVVIEGPAEFTIESYKVIYLSRGRAYTRVLEYGKGFTVRTPSSVLVDVGTEFGVDVNPAGDSQLHVFKGEVILNAGLAQATNRQPIRFKQGQAAEVSKDSHNVRTIALNYDFQESLKKKKVSPPIIFEDFESLALGNLLKRGQWLDKAINGAVPQTVQPGLLGKQGLRGSISTQSDGGCSGCPLPMSYDPAVMTRPLYMSVVAEWDGSEVSKWEKMVGLGFHDAGDPHSNKLSVRFHVGRGIKMAYTGEGGEGKYVPDNAGQFLGRGLSAKRRYLCVFKITPQTATRCNVSAGYLDITDGEVPYENRMRYQLTTEIDPSTFIARETLERYYLDVAGITILSKSVMADNFMVSDNWENIRLSVTDRPF